MKKSLSKIIFAVLGLVVIIGIIVLASKLIRGAAGIVTGAFNTVLGIFVIIALIVIVIWMVSYAKKHK